ncbi:MAG: hypothetical protein H7343_07710 [Undibacterium sp.]|nr:hypothetical protein [Opitutaceae bacterium]
MVADDLATSMPRLVGASATSSSTDFRKFLSSSPDGKFTDVEISERMAANFSARDERRGIERFSAGVAAATSTDVSPLTSTGSAGATPTELAMAGVTENSVGRLTAPGLSATTTGTGK